MPRKSSVVEVVRKGGGGLKMYPKERLFVVAKLKVKNELEGARRFVDCHAKLCVRGSRWLLQVDHVRVKNPNKYMLYFFLTTKKEFTAEEFRLHTVVLRLAPGTPNSKDGNFEKLDKADLHDGFEVPITDTRGIDPRTFRCLFIGKPADAKPATPLAIMFSEARLQPNKETFAGDEEVEERVRVLRAWQGDLTAKLNNGEATRIDGMSYYRLKDAAKTMFEMIGKNRFEYMSFEGGGGVGVWCVCVCVCVCTGG